MGENIFALQLSQPQPQQITPPGFGGVAWDDGLRAVLSVRMIWAKVQTTILFGDSLYMLSYDIGPLTKQDGFKAFLKNWFNHPIIGAQLSQPPFAATPAVYLKANSLPVAPPAPPVATGKIVMLNAGFDAFRGFWIEFAGNYFLTFPIFKNWPNVVRDGPNFKGFQPSANNPGSGGGSGTPPVNIPPTTC
jgi:hypothetical protein